MSNIATAEQFREALTAQIPIRITKDGKPLFIRVKLMDMETALVNSFDTPNPLLNHLIEKGEAKEGNVMEQMAKGKLFFRQIAKAVMLEPKYEEVEEFIGDNYSVLTQIVEGATGTQLASLFPQLKSINGTEGNADK